MGGRISAPPPHPFPPPCVCDSDVLQGAWFYPWHVFGTIKCLVHGRGSSYIVDHMPFFKIWCTVNAKKKIFNGRKLL